MAIVIFFRTILLSLRNIFANKRQNFLAILTVILGSLTISTVYTVNSNVDRYIDFLIGKNGGPNLFVDVTERGQYFSRSDLRSMRGLTSATYVVENAKAPMTLFHGKESLNSRVYMFSKGYSEARPINVLEGQGLGELDIVHPVKNAVVSPTVVKELGIVEPIGKSLTIKMGPAALVVKIVGVAEALYENNNRPKVWIPELSFRYLSNMNKYKSLIVGTNEYSNLNRFEKSVREFLEPAFGRAVNFYNPKSYFERLRSEYETFVNAGTVIGCLALFGGTLGVFNLMLLSIRLRVREIGLYRALGFSSGVVLLLFLLESLVTLSIGGLVGSVLGCFAGLVISSRVVTVAPVISLEAFFYGFAATFVIGIIFSYFPARRAAKIETVEALRS